MTTVPGVAPLLWDFSVWDDAIAKKLDGQMGKRIVVHYKEFRYIPTTCFGETTYFVDRVDVWTAVPDRTRYSHFFCLKK